MAKQSASELSPLQRLNAAMGANTVTTLSRPSREKRVAVGLSTGSLKLNHALSGSPFVGFAWGRIVEILGPEMSGKTTLTLECIVQAQRLEESSGTPVPCLFVDAEHAFDLDYAVALGVDLDRMGFLQPENGEQGLDAVEHGVKSGYKLIVVDSVSALVPKAELEGTMGQAHVGLQARLMSQAMRKLTGIMSRSGCIVIFINQLRFKVGIVFGNPETTSGGNALKFYSSYRLDVRSPRGGAKTGKKTLGDDEDSDEKVETGIVTKVKVVKNKLYPPYRRADIDVIYGKGFDKVKDIIGFLEYSNAFVVPVTSKTGQPVLKIPSKDGKLYTVSGLAKILHEPEVQSDVIAIIKSMEATE